MGKKQQIILGIKLGFIISLLLISYPLYDAVWGSTFFGIQVQEDSQPTYKIGIYESFQDIRDPQNSRWITAKSIGRYGSSSFYLNRIVEIESMTPEEALEYYYKELKNKKLFNDVNLIKNDKRILFKKFMAEGAIIVIKENPTTILVDVGRMS